MGSLLSHEERDEDGALDDASSFPSRNNDADVMHRIVDEMHSSSCGDRTSEPGNCCVALSRQLTVLKAAIKHNINGDADQFSAEAAADVTPQTSRDAHRISMWIDDVLAIAAAFPHELDCPVTMYDNEQRVRRDSKRRRRASHSTVPAASYIVDPQLDVPPTVDKEPHRTAIAAVAAIAMARVQRHGPSQGVIPESEDDESQPRESHQRRHRPPKNDLKVIIQHGRSRSRSGDDLSDGSLSLHQSVSTGVASSPHYPSTTLGDARIHTDVLSRAYHLKQQRNIQRQARARSRHRRGSMTRSASGVTCTTESSGASSMDVFELGAAEDDFPEQHIAIASPREQSASRSLSNLHFSGSNHAARRPPRPRKMSAGGDPPLSGRNAGSARRASATLDSAH